jgi:hypothetical protein
MNEFENWLNENYNDSDGTIEEMIDEEILNLSLESEAEEEGYDDVFEYYLEYGGGEAESNVVDIIVDEYIKFAEIDNQKYTEYAEYVRNRYDLLNR